jgi:hypothetical protein
VGNRRLKYEKLHEHRAKVIAELSEKLYAVQRGVVGFANFATFSDVGVEETYVTVEERDEQYKAANEALAEFAVYFHGNEVWLAPDACEKIEVFLSKVWQPLEDYTERLDERGVPPDAETVVFGQQIVLETIPLRVELIAEFREILYPPPWYEAPLRWLEWLEAWGRKKHDNA